MKLQTKMRKPTQKQTAIAFGVTDRTIRNWDKRRRLRKFSRGLGRKSKIQDPILGRLLRHYASQLKKGILSTQQEVAERIFQETGKKISQPTISRYLKKRKVTCKKINYHYTEQLNHPEKIINFIKKIPYLSKSPILALDECSFHLNEVPRYAYAIKGKRANRRKPSRKGNNHTLNLCISNLKGKGVVKWELIKGGMKSENFHKFISELPIDKKHYLLLDNLKVHHATKSCQKKGLSTIKELLTNLSNNNYILKEIKWVDENFQAPSLTDKSSVVSDFKKQ